MFLDEIDTTTKYAIGSTAALAYISYRLLQDYKKKGNSPAVGPSGPLGWLAYIKHSSDILDDGYRKYKPANGAFRIPMYTSWGTVVTSEKQVEELRRAPEHVLSFHDATDDMIQMAHTMGQSMNENMYHTAVVRSQLTRNLPALFPEVHDELIHAFADEIPTKGNEWVKVKATPAIQRVVSRASNRIFVGLPLCRNAEWRDMNISFTIDVVMSAQIINMFPEVLKPLVAKFLVSVPRTVKRAKHHVAPLIEERLSLPREERPNDLLTWLMDEAPEGPERTVDGFTRRLLMINFAAIHTSSMSFTQALYSLAAHPEYQQPIREEIETISHQHGWTKLSMGKMRKLDSFMKECQRLYGLGNLSLTRKAAVDFTFSDGTFVPKGAYVAAPSHALHRDNAIYTNAEEFDGFRFANMRDEEGEGAKHQMVATSPTYLPFGHGQHACPGRFFAANELKCALAVLIMHYDIKLENEGVRPENQWFRFACVPNSEAEVMFRKRHV